jgi:FAD/FMN-containing dehydrogenase
MKFILFSTLISLAALSAAVEDVQGPAECKVIPGDSAWPAPATWAQELPGVKEQKSGKGAEHANYRFDVNSVDQVIAAVKFTKRHNVRLSILNSGHDFHGRNDAPNGLVLVLRALKGARILPSFTPTTEGAKPVDSSIKENGSAPLSGPGYVTFGVGYSTKELNDFLAPAKLFTLGAAHASVSVAGGWGQTAGHAPLSAQYGLGVDQFMEYKVVTADGVLRIANAASNPDLFWALRGGGGGTFGVVVEATVKAHVSPKMSVGVAWVNTTDPNDSKSMYPALAWLHTQFPAAAENGMTIYYFASPTAMSVVGINAGVNGTRTWLRENWKPVVQKLPTFSGMNNDSFVYLSLKYDNYKAFFDYIINNEKTPVTKNGSMGHAPSPMRTLWPRHGPGESMLTQSRGASNIDSWLLDKGAMSSPNFAKALESSMPKVWLGELRGQVVGGGKVFQSNNDISLLPAWRKAYVHLIMVGSGQPNATALRKLAPNMGEYVNEASRLTPDWRNAFWGSNYGRLSKIKKKYDPDHLLWVTPGIDADAWTVKGPRLCKTTLVAEQSATIHTTEIAPKGDNPNAADVLQEWKDSKGPPFLLIKHPNGTDYLNPEYQDEIDNNPELLADEGE